MDKVELVNLERLAHLLKGLSPAELETLEFLLQPELATELKQRRQEAKTELKEGKTLSKVELFVD
jgi:hypothetical protein